MSKGHLFKHLSYFLIHRPSSLRPQLSVFRFLHQWKKPNSSSPISRTGLSSPFARCFSSSVSTSPSTTTCESSAYHFVQIHFPKHVADDLSEALLCFGASSTSMDEEDGLEGANRSVLIPYFPSMKMLMCAFRKQPVPLA